MTADFGYDLPTTGAIGDYVWEDINGDGIQDVTEEGIGNVTLRLWQDVNSDGILQPITDTMRATTTTDADGGYIFPHLPPGKYIVEVTDTNGILTGAAMQPTSGPQSRLSPYPVTLSAGEIERDVDFGYRTPPIAGRASVGDTVWWDPNQNGVRDPGEAGIPGVTVQLKSAGPDGLFYTPDDLAFGFDVNGHQRRIPDHQCATRRVLCGCGGRHPTWRHRLAGRA